MSKVKQPPVGVLAGKRAWELPLRSGGASSWTNLGAPRDSKGMGSRRRGELPNGWPLGGPETSICILQQNSRRLRSGDVYTDFIYGI